MMVFIAESNS